MIARGMNHVQVKVCIFCPRQHSLYIAKQTRNGCTINFCPGKVAVLVSSLSRYTEQKTLMLLHEVLASSAECVHVSHHLTVLVSYICPQK